MATSKKGKIVAPRKGGQPGNQNAKGCTTSGQPQMYTDEWIRNEAKTFREWLQLPDSFFFTKFATDRGYCIQRLTEFADRSIEFSEVLKYAKDTQHNRLVTSSLKNEINSQITKFVLANHHGYSDRQQLSGDAANPLGFLLTKADGESQELVSNDD